MNMIIGSQDNSVFGRFDIISIGHDWANDSKTGIVRGTKGCIQMKLAVYTDINTAQLVVEDLIEKELAGCDIYKMPPDVGAHDITTTQQQNEKENE